jgi:hypothetical protein
MGENFVLGLGKLAGTAAGNWKVASRDRNPKWQTPVIQGEWQNFAVTLDYDKKYVFNSLRSPKQFLLWLLCISVFETGRANYAGSSVL